jgi:hypothetical protein
MKAYKKRMIKEYWQLRKRIDKLNAKTIRAQNDRKVSDKQYRLLQAQLFSMCAYEGILRQRIEDLGLELS